MQIIFNEIWAARFSTLNWFNNLCTLALDNVKIQISSCCNFLPLDEWLYSSSQNRLQKSWTKYNLLCALAAHKGPTNHIHSTCKICITSYLFGLTNNNKRNASFLFSTINRLFTPALCSFPATSSDDCGNFLIVFLAKISGIRSKFKPGTCHSVQLSQPILFSHFYSISMTDLLDIFSHMYT